MRRCKIGVVENTRRDGSGGPLRGVSNGPPHSHWLQGPFKPPGGRLVHFLHHIGTTSSTAHEASAVNGELSAMYVEAGRFGDEPPAIIVRCGQRRKHVRTARR